jgi:hypothetical protein
MSAEYIRVCNKQESEQKSRLIIGKKVSWKQKETKKREKLVALVLEKLMHDLQLLELIRV